MLQMQNNLMHILMEEQTGKDGGGGCFSYALAAIMFSYTSDPQYENTF